MNRLLVYQKYLWLQEYCSSPDFDSKVFRTQSDYYAKAYQKLDQEDQGWIAEQLDRLI